MQFFIDVVGACNLRCPSCPVGNSERGNVLGVMSPDLLDRILEKAVTECKVSLVGLYNWTEPFLHPQLEKLVNVVNKYRVDCAVSTNLNLNKIDRYRKVLEQNPRRLRVSLSGFDQEKYSLTHAGGFADNVMRNLETLAQLKKETSSTTIIQVAFIRYLSNLDQVDKVKSFCAGHDMHFHVGDALMLPLEKLLGYCGEPSFLAVNEDDEKTIANLSLPLKQGLDVAARVDVGVCKRLDEQMPLNCNGEAMLCCIVYDEKKFVVGDYLNDSLETIQAARRNHAICSMCIKHGASNYTQYIIPDKDMLVAENIRQHAIKSDRAPEGYK